MKRTSAPIALQLEHRLAVLRGQPLGIVEALRDKRGIENDGGGSSARSRRKLGGATAMTPLPSLAEVLPVALCGAALVTAFAASLFTTAPLAALTLPGFFE